MIDDKRAAELMAAIDDVVCTTCSTIVDPEAALRGPTGPRSMPAVMDAEKVCA